MVSESGGCDEEIEEKSIILSVFMVICGLVAVVFGGNLVVEQASSIASSFGVSQTLVGLTIVAIGTSLPELVTSIIACKKGNWQRCKLNNSENFLKCSMRESRSAVARSVLT